MKALNTIFGISFIVVGCIECLVSVITLDQAGLIMGCVVAGIGYFVFATKDDDDSDKKHKTRDRNKGFNFHGRDYYFSHT
jgi:hypothetical protein